MERCYSCKHYQGVGNYKSKGRNNLNKMINKSEKCETKEN